MIRLESTTRSFLVNLCLVAPALYLPAILLGYRWYFFGILLSFLSACLLLIEGRSVPPAFKTLGAALLGWLTICFLSALWADYPETTLLACSYVAMLASFYFGGVAVGSFPAMIQARVFSLCVLSVVGVFAYMVLAYGTVRPVTDEVARVFGAGSNAGGMHVVVALPILLWRLQVARSKWSLVLLLLALLAVAISQSRAAYLSLAVGFMSWLILYKSLSFPRSTRLVLGASLIGLLGLIALAVSPKTVMRLMNVGMAVSDPSLLVGEGQGDFSRLATYYFGWVAYQENPILGIGYKNLQPFIEDRVGFGEGSHNLLVTLFSETGLPGAISFFIILFVFFKLLKIAVRSARGDEEANWRIAVGVAMSIALLNGMFHQIPEFQLFYFLLGIAASWRGADEVDARIRLSTGFVTSPR